MPNPADLPEDDLKRWHNAVRSASKTHCFRCNAPGKFLDYQYGNIALAHCTKCDAEWQYAIMEG